MYELEALRAIYGDDFTDRPPVWKNPSFAIAIRPLGDHAQIFCSILLCVTLNPTYPKSAPTIELENVKGLSDSQTADLKALLAQVAQRQLNEVMIHEIASAAEAFLDANNAKPLTLHEAMEARQIEQTAAMRRIKHDFLLDDDNTAGTEGVATISGHPPLHHQELTTSALPDAAVTRIPERERSTSDMSNFEGIDWNALYKVKGGASAPQESLYDNMDLAADIESDDGDEVDLLAETSRYKLEFREIALLGRGASGQVWKVVNRLDKRTYAVKKILLDSNDSVLNKKIRREVTTISRLLHNHIVRYYAAWYETTAKVAPSSGVVESSLEESTGFQSSESSASAEGAGDNVCRKSANNQKCVTGGMYDPLDGLDMSFIPPGEDSSSSQINSNSDSESSTENSDSSCSESEDDSDTEDEIPVEGDCEIIFEDSGGIGFGLSNHGSSNGRNSRPHAGNSSRAYWKKQSSGSYDGSEVKVNLVDLGDIESNMLESPPADGDGNAPTTSKDVVKCLYLQMEFCETTLREFIDSFKLWDKPEEVFRLLSQLLDALAYIHAKDMIHRDLKVHICCCDYSLRLFD